MMARRETAGTLEPDERDRLQAAVVDAIDFSHEVLSESVPGVLDPGLSAGLVALDAAIPLTTRLDLSGDVPAEDPVAAALWFVASEAVANSLKHADAHEIQNSSAGRPDQRRADDHGRRVWRCDRLARSDCPTPSGLRLHTRGDEPTRWRHDDSRDRSPGQVSRRRVKRLALTISCAALGVSIWLGWLSRRPVEFTLYRTSIDLMRIWDWRSESAC